MDPGVCCASIITPSSYQPAHNSKLSRNNVSGRAELREAAMRALDLQYQDMCEKLDEQTRIILSRFEELLGKQMYDIKGAIGSPPRYPVPNAEKIPPLKSTETAMQTPDDPNANWNPSDWCTFPVATRPAVSQGTDAADERKGRKTDLQSMVVPTGDAATEALVDDDADGTPETFEGRTSWVKKLVKRQRFDMVFGGLICLNAVVMAIELEYIGTKAGDRVGKCRAAEISGATIAFAVIDHIFCWVFLGELILRLIGQGILFLSAPVNWIDPLTVALSLLDLYVIPLAAGGLDLPDLGFMRLLRMVKLVKVLRIVRVMRLFHQLRVLVVAIGSSIGALIWSIIFLTIVQSIASIFMTQVLVDIIADPQIESAVRHQCFHYFGRWSFSMLTMYQITLAPAAWGPIGRLLIFEVSSAFAIFFVLYGWLVSFAVVKVIGAMFLKQTLAAAAGDGEVAIIERLMQKQKDNKRMKEIFTVADKDGSGSIDWEEFQAMVKTPAVLAWLAMQDMEIQDMTMVFALLDDGRGEVSYEEFIQGVLRCRGGARGVDVASLVSEGKEILDEIERITFMLQDYGYLQQRKSVRGVTTEAYRGLAEFGNMEMEKLGELDENVVVIVGNKEDPRQPGEGWKAKIRSTRFDVLCGVVICLNAVVMGVELEFAGIQNEALLSNKARNADIDSTEWLFTLLDHLFSITFTVELVLRLIAYGKQFLKLAMNWIDIFTVTTSLVELYVFGLMVSGTDVPDMRILQLMRLLRLVKVARIFRVMKLFHQLRVLVLSIVSTVAALFWAIILVAVIQFIAAIMMTTLSTDYIMDTPDTSLGGQVFDYFGRTSRSMLTMHQMTLAPGPWSPIGRLLIFNVSAYYVIFFVMFGWGMTFAIIRVISAIFLKQVLAAAAGDGETAMLERVRKKTSDVQKLKMIFQAGDKDGSGAIDWDEFVAMLDNPRVRAWLGILELDVSDLATVFNLLDDGDGQIGFDEFIKGVMKCRGPARGVEVVNLISEYKTIRHQMEKITEGLRNGPRYRRSLVNEQHIPPIPPSADTTRK